MQNLNDFWAGHLDSTEGVEQVRVVSDAGAEASAVMLTGFDEIYDFLQVHSVQLTHQVHYCQTPVDPAHPEVLRQSVLLRTQDTRSAAKTLMLLVLRKHTSTI